MVAAFSAAIKLKFARSWNGHQQVPWRPPRRRIFSSPPTCDLAGSILTRGEEDVNFDDANPDHPAMTLRQRKPLRCFVAAFRGNAVSISVTPALGMLLRTMPVPGYQQFSL